MKWLNKKIPESLAGEPKHFPFADVFVFIVKSTFISMSCWYFQVIFRRFWLLFANLRPKNFRALLRLLITFCRDHLFSSSDQNFLLPSIFWRLYSKNRRKWPKWPTLSILCSNISAHRFFPDMRFVAVNSKYSLVSYIFELGIFNDAPRHHSQMYLFSSLGSRRVPPSA